MIWDSVVAEQIWDEKTLKEYAAYNCRLLRNKIMSLCTIDAPSKEIISILEKMKEDRFYQRILSETEEHDRFVVWFERGEYKRLIRTIRLRVKLIRLLGR